MIVRMGILRKKEGMPVNEFHKYWYEKHGPLASNIPEIINYTQNHVTDSSQLGINFARGNIAVDGFSQLWFEDKTKMEKGFSEMAQVLPKDEKEFIGDIKIIVAKQNVIKPTPHDQPLIKRMSILKRRSDVDFETFQYEWNKVHAKHILSMPGVEGYTQNVITDQSIKKEISSEYNDVSIDGIVELWFRDIASLENAFKSTNGQKAMKHASTFIEEISTFIVEPYRIV
ncbi:EthD family reductase [Neobacillus sp. NPDC097160]|uniref:EthD domain-containing protein n=1 Tax=Neobacillus sp. NPDC097160 TaxID=3364298 RepID=UPI0037F74D9B